MKFTSFVIGMGAGAALAILFAPRSGEETRAMISDKARAGRRFAEERARDIRDMANDAVERGKDAINRPKNAVTAAVQAGKEAYNSEAQKVS